MIGTTLGPYTIERELGSGGMGTVYRAHQTTVGRDVAIKVLRAELARDEQAVFRFEREARVAISLDHPNLVRVFLSGRLKDGRLYIVMELLSGESVVDRLMRTEKEMTLAQATELVGQVCDALDHIHGRGIVHRDLKGENTFLLGTSENIYVKLLDFGLAKAPGLSGAPALTVPGQQIGSPELTALARGGG